ncbi:hypothetical protein BWQ93_01675 [Sphingopyxis sp. QXT-31]|uniref:helix-turn-helix transcriptional regulator n=1 Tax=Sphingopyxis sp. QXT-31 TaxID=1357916 RepID=UPI0009792B53|nr:helix-turn-helix domain-containing protein [Sphingopyxis sp. QXT-31]APZ97343.1 hypothetical protein BWQ93_01675 [Sphingopyxis sp. QXT-31]
MQPNYLNTEEAAQYLRMGVSTLNHMRVRGDGPTWSRLGTRRVVYARADLDAWAAAGARTSTSEAA